MLNNILELSKKATQGGRVPIKIALLKIHEDVNETNKNGIHWELEYVKRAMESAKMMPICAEFCTEEKSTPFGHGLTETIISDDGIKEPLFQNSETVGVIENVSIEDISEGDSTIKVLCGNGYLFNQRYPNFVKWVRQNYALSQVDTSIEIMGLPENNNKISYLEDNPTDEYRTPMAFLFSGTAIISLSPADDDAVVLEVAQKQKIKEENKLMEFNLEDFKSAIKSTILECNAKDETFISEINELTEQLKEKETCIEEKEKEICALTASVEQVQKALDELKAEHDSYWTEREVLEKELGKLRAEKRISELNEAIKEFTDDERKFAESEINSFNENPMNSEIDAIVSKIYAEIGKAKKATDEKVTELNSKKFDVDVDDIFSEMCAEALTSEDDDTNIF
ncbi:hypothetical protein GKG47_08900 [Lactonifactor sp. BIOML-A3]|uniref:hypothetical protein n=1 Tax=unclassified Lactonifactor TaxID=2636670 RepID=UPI0012B12360|nr:MULTISPECIES: hypothetical protein [unclassified Lactonifactor]MSA02158.1 hypothetical protein [Lactonifactor sp. BIOML-A5]MSA07943.1 hypothetical protein [Lactonifactor sp. BIOML-A4]MSA12559.1 hypothetical protein [Lactonifactor sp. BIOML-A3]MSA16740.1 hypothetical protein [Lactonifactor sp. BIOML-A2]MSA37561.1 hypothetical protein [Lactonifactor sp. BIOML-A1]